MLRSTMVNTPADLARPTLHLNPLFESAEPDVPRLRRPQYVTEDRLHQSRRTSPEPRSNPVACHHLF